MALASLATYGSSSEGGEDAEESEQVARDKSALLEAKGSAPLVIEELLGISLYTSPMYLKCARHARLRILSAA